MPDDVVKDSLLSEFIARTGSDPALAWDLLNGTNWDLDEGLRAYVELANIPNDQWPDVLDCPKKSGAPSNASGPAKDEPRLPPPPAMQRGISRVEDNKGIVKKMHKRNRHNSGEAALSSLKSSLSTISDKPTEVSSSPKPFPDACFSITIPDLSMYQKGFRDYLERELVEKSTLVALQESGRLNWWTENGAAQPLYPMVTTGDGNCLLHAASLAMWGFHDRELVLRKALYAPLKDGSAHLEAFKRRWRYSQTLINQQSGLIWSDEEWNREWDCMLQLASSEPRRYNQSQNSGTSATSNCGQQERTHSFNEIDRTAVEATEKTNLSNTRMRSSTTSGWTPQQHSQSRQTTTSTSSNQMVDRDQPPMSNANRSASVDSMASEQYESLEEFHVFLLANILRRPVIIVADLFLRDNRGENFAPIPFGGVYLPLECNSQQCHHFPLLLTFDAAHFSALVPMEPPGNTTLDSTTNSVERPPVVIPLTDSVGELLHIHFPIDPGPDFDWALMENEDFLEQNQLSAEDKLFLMHKYLKIEVISLSGRKIDPNEVEIISTNHSSNGEGDREAVAMKSKSKDGKSNRSASLGSKKSTSKSKLNTKSATMQGGLGDADTRSRSNSSKDSAGNSPRNLGSSGKSASNTTKPKVVKKQSSIFGNLGRKLRKCFNSSSSAIPNESEIINKELMQENNLLIDKVERTLTLLSISQQIDKRFIAAKVDIANKPGYFADMIRSYLDSAERKYCAELQQLSRKCRSCNELKCVCRVNAERVPKPQTLPRDLKIDQNVASPVIKHVQSRSIPVANSKYSRNSNTRSDSADQYSSDSDRSVASRRNVPRSGGDQYVFQSTRSYQFSSSVPPSSSNYTGANRGSSYKL
ncbi:OTU domain-containing protein 7B-like isoform X3 [Symsagittifera roscoffensis]|uniref:OTU domain-containing protein 7B-like isoform X3 n=1 Tax=Symsagittifera roscoffensis TaxID=84072 RepID=UPI00307B6385